MDIAEERSAEYYFTALMDSGKTLYNLLKGIQFQESAIMSVLPEGLKITVEEGKCVQATAYVPAENFTEYRVSDHTHVIFKVSLAVLTECLNIFGSGEEFSLKMYYRSEGSPLILVLQPQSVSNVMTDCEIRTQTADSLLELRDEDATQAAMLVLNAPVFHLLLADLERTCDILELNISQRHPQLSIVTYGMQEKSCFGIGSSSDMMQSIQCEEDVTFKYQLSHIRLMMKALAASKTVVIRCSSSGLLLAQLMLEKEDQRKLFSEFHVVPLLEE